MFFLEKGTLMTVIASLMQLRVISLAQTNHYMILNVAKTYNCSRKWFVVDDSLEDVNIKLEKLYMVLRRLHLGFDRFLQWTT